MPQPTKKEETSKPAAAAHPNGPHNGCTTALFEHRHAGKQQQQPKVKGTDPHPETGMPIGCHV